MAGNVLRFPPRPRLIMRELDYLKAIPEVQRYGRFLVHEQADGLWSLSLVWSGADETKARKWKEILTDATHDEVHAEARWQSLFMFSEFRLNVLPGLPVGPDPVGPVAA